MLEQLCLAFNTRFQRTCKNQNILETETENSFLVQWKFVPLLARCASALKWPTRRFVTIFAPLKPAGLKKFAKRQTFSLSAHFSRPTQNHRQKRVDAKSERVTTLFISSKTLGVQKTHKQNHKFCNKFSISLFSPSTFSLALFTIFVCKLLVRFYF